MKKDLINEVHLEGLLYDHRLSKKVTGASSKKPGTEYIAGNIDIATDDKMENIVSIHYTYVTATTGKGNANPVFPVLSKILAEEKTVVKVGKDEAFKVRCDTAIGLYEWYREVTDEKPVSLMRNEGGFIHIVNDINEDPVLRNKFKCDIVITGVKTVGANPEKGMDEHVKIRGCVFNFNKAILPVELVVRSQGGMNYFNSLDASPKTPVFTCVWGREQSQTIVTKTVTESAFGEDEVRERSTSNREFIITGCSKTPYVWDDESTITAAEMSKGISDRELYLATMKQRQAEFQASKNTATSTSAVDNSGLNYGF